MPLTESMGDICVKQRVLVKCPSINCAILLATNFVRYCASRTNTGIAVLVDSDAVKRVVVELLSELVDEGIVEVIEFSNASSLRDRYAYCVITFELRKIPENTWLATYVRSGRRALGDAVMCTVVSIDAGKYAMLCRDLNIACFKFVGERIAEESCGLEVEALKVLSSYQREFGSLTVRDAVNALSLELGISRDEARRVLGRLKLMKVIDLKKGFVELKYIV